MIAFADGLPLVQLEDGQSVAFQREWLLRSLVQAAGRAGFQKWWLADHVTESVTAYLALQYEENIITVPQLHEAACAVLQVIGYAEVAPHLELGVPGVRLSLVELAREAGSGYELLFFARLGRRLRAHLHGGATYFELVGLAPCVKHLRARKSWSRGCNDLQEEIVTFVRKQTVAVPTGEEVTVRLQ